MNFSENIPDGLTQDDLDYIDGYDEDEEEREQLENDYWDREIDKALGK